MLRMVLSFVVSDGDTKMFPLSLKFAAAGALFILTAAVHSPYADESEKTATARTIRKWIGQVGRSAD